MYPACLRGRLTTGRDGLRGSNSKHCGALGGAMTKRRVPIQVLTIVPSLPSSSRGGRPEMAPTGAADQPVGGAGVGGWAGATRWVIHQATRLGLR